MATEIESCYFERIKRRIELTANVAHVKRLFSSVSRIALRDLNLRETTEKK